MGIPNAAAQRQEMINAIRNVSADLRALRGDLKTTEFKTRVTGMPAGTTATGSRNNHRESNPEQPVVQITRVPVSAASADDSRCRN